MPTYQDPRHGVSMSAAIAEAAAVAPDTRVMLTTFELYHPTCGRKRVVNNTTAFLATLEDDAPEDGGVEVEFLASRISINEPEESDQAGTPEISLTINNVSGLMSDALKLARGSLIPWQLTERVYASDDPSGPAILPPVVLLLSSCDSSGDAVIVKASFGDPAFVNIPRNTFTRAKYPGLQR